MKIKFVFVITFLFCLFSCSSTDTAPQNTDTDNNTERTPCINGFAGDYPCNDYDLMSNIPVSILASSTGTPEGSDVWGWTDSTTNKEYALVGTTNSTAFVDVSDPLNPIFLGRLNTNAGTNYWRDIKVFNNHAFIVADGVGAHGMQVFDLTKLRNVTNPPINFTADAIYTGVESCHNIVINEDKGIAYLVGCRSTNGGGPIFIDITNPTNPTYLGDHTADGYSHDAQVITYNGPDIEYNGKEIYVGSNENEVVVLDVTDKTNIVKLSSISYSQIGYTHQGWFTDDHKYFILGDETDEQNFGMNTRTLVFDLQDLNNPILSSTYSGSSKAIDHNGYVLDNNFYVANYRAGMRVLDISNISASTNSMTEIGYFDTYPADDATAFNGAWSVYPYFSSGNIIINDIERGLFVIRKSGS
ncbi:choice-of-anchor B domain-containing protein [Tenacibaculum adriaticum]|uniref:Choice-of-anchor B domain-containing protein n=1 Tax=Tenacibaculum adriaticum TaxID=413713 RepID=A0A5S5DW18_9FLAO|nr:choice-of-anchor B family protein [Tenacibaculum adriaticum]TYQ00016.1 choice-of-anchor B domain-containing protein [Tenacibaculum adriaticum]